MLLVKTKIGKSTINVQNSTTARKIGSDFLKSKKVLVRFIGKGSNNQNFLARSKDRTIVIKLSFAHKEYKALQDYKKEKWCIERSRERGVLGPTVLDVGRAYQRAYMIETFVPGTNGKKLKSTLHTYHELGRYARRIHGVRVSGFGENLTNSKRGIFRGSWKKYLQYNIKSLTDNDRLIDLKVLTKKQSTKVKNIFQTIQKKNYHFGLNHGDLTLQNTLVEKSGKVHLLDWGSAEVHIIPHFDLMHLLRCQIEQGRPTDSELNQYIKGYGMSQKKFQLLKPELYKLMLLNAIDKVRWALDRNPSRVKDCCKWARKMIKMISTLHEQ